MMIVLTLCPATRYLPAVPTLLKLHVGSSQHPRLIIKITIGTITNTFALIFVCPGILCFISRHLATLTEMITKSFGGEENVLSRIPVDNWANKF